MKDDQITMTLQRPQIAFMAKDGIFVNGFETAGARSDGKLKFLFREIYLGYVGQEYPSGKLL
jgi:hypothetical protein